MANFIGGTQVLNSRIQSGIKGQFILTGNKLYIAFLKTANFSGIKNYSANKAIISSSTSTTTTRITGQLFP